LIDAAERGDTEALAFQFGEIGRSGHARGIHLVADIDRAAAAAGPVVAAVEEDHHGRALGDAVEQPRRHGHERDVELARDHGRHGERAVHEDAGVDVETELGEIAFVARDEIGTARNERPFADMDRFIGEGRR
jgi:hypothetical protein